ncbi:NADAR family protein [Flavobacterium lipolyticum]|uniref:NADAR family protein n=1 Tax=Flavobacterium lipolyticum TaxID=2893754 RepID=A0ABS8LY95_9FLAO|nr:NADAR family protein [Flavobacterium sp. F-126]MCC9017546.1 NADAR family protein [Flavobacterium sp. F-126]
MKYNIDTIAPESKFLFFWGHQPTKDGSISKTCFSQWWLSAFTVDKVTYKTAEHWMMAKKAELFNDNEVLAKIIKANSPAEAKKLGRQVKNYDDTLWLANRFDIVTQGNYHKFSQNPDLKAFLLNTDERVIVEASPVDPIWGIGMAGDHKDVLNPEKWKGLNLLGFALMEVRDELR